MNTAELPAREAMEFDVVIVGAGPAGLAAAIRLKQLAPDKSVVVRGEGLRSRRPYPVRRGDRSDRPRQPDPGMARRGQRRSRRRSPRTASTCSARRGALRLPNFADAAADEQSRQFHRLARRCLPLAGAQGRSARRRNLSGLCRRRSAVRRTARSPASPPATWASARTATTRPGFARGMELRGKYTLFAEGARGSLSKMLIERFGLGAGSRAAEIRHRPEGALAGRAGKASAAAWCSTRSAGRSTTAPAAARSSIISTTIWFRSASSSISTTRIPICRRSRSSSASRPIRWCATLSPAASAFATARAPSPRAAGSRCRSWPFRAAR